MTPYENFKSIRNTLVLIKFAQNLGSKHRLPKLKILLFLCVYTTCFYSFGTNDNVVLSARYYINNSFRIREYMGNLLSL